MYDAAVGAVVKFYGATVSAVLALSGAIVVGCGAYVSCLGMQIRSEFNLNSPNSLRIRSQREFAANSA